MESKFKTANFESLQDTTTDIMGYALIAQLLLNDQWNERLLEDRNAVDLTLSHLRSVFVKKMQDYGVRDVEEYGIEGVINRLTDKLARLKNLLKHPINLENTKSIGHIQWKKLNHEAEICKPKKTGDAGFDLTVAEDTIVPPLPQLTATLIPARVGIKAPEGYFCQILGRSSAANKRGLLVVSAVIDQGYRGELSACVFNMTGVPVEVKKGERIGQVVFFPLCVPDIEEVDVLPDSERGDNGYGSTGK